MRSFNEAKRAEFETTKLDHVEESKLAADNCPLRRGASYGEGLDTCEESEGYCVYETDDGPCELLPEVMKDMNICGECGQERPGDERVQAGMKCGICAGEYLQ